MAWHECAPAARSRMKDPGSEAHPLFVHRNVEPACVLLVQCCSIGTRRGARASGVCPHACLRSACCMAWSLEHLQYQMTTWHTMYSWKWSPCMYMLHAYAVIHVPMQTEISSHPSVCTHCVYAYTVTVC